MCKEWLNSFEEFYKDMGESPKRSSLERKDNEKGYFPENCKWANATEQANNRSSNYNVKHNGKNYTLSQLSGKSGVSRDKLKYLIQKKHDRNTSNRGG